MGENNFRTFIERNYQQVGWEKNTVDDWHFNSICSLLIEKRKESFNHQNFRVFKVRA